MKETRFPFPLKTLPLSFFAHFNAFFVTSDITLRTFPAGSSRGGHVLRLSRVVRCLHLLFLRLPVMPVPSLDALISLCLTGCSGEHGSEEPSLM